MDSGCELKLHCPSCGGEAFLDAQTGEVVCPACSASAHAGDIQRESTQQGIRGMLCRNCGAALMADVSLSSATCPYCGSTDMASQDISGEPEPDGILPFT
ncbi:MAG: hypothetical protein J5804_03010, partial [Eggerthellaceae bacterium]|nr:hypothetical protein [Eggerthellaceae bacterium]